MSTNKQMNLENIKKFRKELNAMFQDITNIDIKVLNKAMLIGIRTAKDERVTPVDTGFLKNNWAFHEASKMPDGSVEGDIYNNVEYAPHVNYGHRIKSKNGKTIGFVKGRYMTEHIINAVDKALAHEFDKEVERVNRKHDK